MKFLDNYIDKGLTAVGLKSKPKIEKNNKEDDTSSKIQLINKAEKTGTYQRLLDIIVDESLSSLPRDVTAVLGYEFVSVFKDGLLHMRKEGIAYCIYVHDRLFFDKSIELIENKEYKNSPDFNNRFSFKYHNEIYPYSSVIVFGDLLNQTKGKFSLNTLQKNSILQYENILQKLYPKIDDAHAWIFKLQGYNDSKFNLEHSTSRQIKSKIKELANRNSSSIAILDKDDDFSNTQLNLDWIDKFIHIYQTKICLDNNIPFTKLFGEGATGLNATGEGDRKSWYDKVRSFQIINIFNQLKKYADIIGKKAEFKGVVMEELDVTDRQANAVIDNQRIQSIISSCSSSLLDYECGESLVHEILGIHNKEKNKTDELNLQQYVGVQSNER